VIVRFVDICGIVDNHCLNFLFLKKNKYVYIFFVFRQKNGNRSFPFYVFCFLFPIPDKTITDFAMSNTTDVLLETRAAHHSGSHGFTPVYVCFEKSILLI
jgi:hypothetical protein